MPKIRDLGINTIPVTMRPPEIGGGGGMHACQGSHDGTSACSEASCMEQGKRSHENCPDASCIHDDDDGDNQSGCPDASCIDDEQSGCPEASCADDGNTSGCPEASCVDDDDDQGGGGGHPHGPKKTSAFSPESIAQLKQQLDQHINS